MRVRRRLWILQVAFLAALPLVAGAAAEEKSKRPVAAKKETRLEAGPTAMLFVVSRGPTDAFIDPIMLMTSNRAVEPPAAGSKDFRAFAARYYKDGRKYRLLFGGSEAGAIVVRRHSTDRDDCLGAQTAVDLQMTAQTQSKIGGLVMGLATDTDLLGRRSLSRRFPTASERASVLDLARRLYLKKGLPASSLRSINPVNMTAMDLNDDSRAEVVATFSVRGNAKPESRHFLFLIAEPQARGYKTAVARYETITARGLPRGGTLAEVDEYVLTEVLIDQLDIDGDGTSEVITADKSWEGITYRIYKKRKVGWKKVYEVYNYRCAF